MARKARKQGQQREQGSLLAERQYVREVRRMVPLSSEEEAYLFALVIQGNDEVKKLHPDEACLRQRQQARDRLMLALQALVMHIAGAFLPSFRHVEWMDLVQEGNEALLHLLQSDHLHQVTSLRKLAAWWIRKAMLKVLYYQEPLIRVREDLSRLARQAHRVEGQLMSTLGRVPRLGEVAEAMQLAEEELRQTLEWHERGTRVENLQALWESEESEEGLVEEMWLDLVERAAPVPGPSIEQQVVVREQVRVALARLAPRQRELLCRRYGLEGMGNGEASRAEVAHAMGIAEISMGKLEHEARQALAKQLSVQIVRGRAEYSLQTPELEQGSYYTVAEVQERVGVTQQSVYRLVQEGKLQGVRPPGSQAAMVFARAEVEAFLAVRQARRERGQVSAS